MTSRARLDLQAHNGSKTATPSAGARGVPASLPYAGPMVLGGAGAFFVENGSVSAFLHAGDQWLKRTSRGRAVAAKVARYWGVAPDAIKAKDVILAFGRSGVGAIDGVLDAGYWAADKAKHPWVLGGMALLVAAGAATTALPLSLAREADRLRNDGDDLEVRKVKARLGGGFRGAAAGAGWGLIVGALAGNFLQTAMPSAGKAIQLFTHMALPLLIGSYKAYEASIRAEVREQGRLRLPKAQEHAFQTLVDQGVLPPPSKKLSLRTLRQAIAVARATHDAADDAKGREIHAALDHVDALLRANQWPVLMQHWRVQAYDRLVQEGVLPAPQGELDAKHFRRQVAKARWMPGAQHVDSARSKQDMALIKGQSRKEVFALLENWQYDALDALVRNGIVSNPLTVDVSAFKRQLKAQAQASKKAGDQETHNQVELVRALLKSRSFGAVRAEFRRTVE